MICKHVETILTSFEMLSIGVGAVLDIVSVVLMFFVYGHIWTHGHTCRDRRFDGSRRSFEIIFCL